MTAPTAKPMQARALKIQSETSSGFYGQGFKSCTVLNRSARLPAQKILNKLGSFFTGLFEVIIKDHLFKMLFKG
jgi:hypothetical protein